MPVISAAWKHQGAEYVPAYAVFTFQLWIRNPSGIVQQIHDLLLDFRSVRSLVFSHVEHLYRNALFSHLIL